jgi:hypothetical protein
MRRRPGVRRRAHGAAPPYASLPARGSAATSPRPGCSCTPPRQAKPATPSARSGSGAGPTARSPIPRLRRPDRSSPPPVRSRTTLERASTSPPSSGARAHLMSCSPPTAGSPPCMRAGRPGQPPPAGGGDGRDHGLEPEHHHYSNAPLAANSAGMIPPPVQRRPLQRDQRRLGGRWGHRCSTRMPARRGTPGARTAARSSASRRRSRQARTRPRAGGEHRPQVHRDRHGRQAGQRHLGGPTSRDATAYLSFS